MPVLSVEIPVIETERLVLREPRMADLPAFAAGQEAVALLYARRLDSPLVGFSQGWYPVVGGKVTAGDREKPITDPAALRDAIRAARGAQ